jgi:hypothetical protein
MTTPCAPRESDWYVEVIHDLPGGGECDYSYEYFKGAEPSDAIVASLVPQGRVLLESTVKATRKGA